MESYVKEKRGLLGKLYRCFCVLDGQHLSMYTGLNKNKTAAVGLQAVYFIKDATVEKVVVGRNSNGIKLVLAQGSNKTVIIDCYTSTSCNDWYSSLFKAVSSHEKEAASRELLQKHLKLLGFNPHHPMSDLSKSQLKKAYTRASRKSHPDKVIVNHRDTPHVVITAHHRTPPHTTAHH
jgi:hypothetical protein